MPWNEILLERLPRWALSLAAVGAVLLVAFQMLRGDALVCGDGSIFSKSCDPITAVDLPTGAVVAFDTENCPPGWTEYQEANGRFVVGVGFDSQHNKYGNAVEDKTLGATGGSDQVKLEIDHLPSHFHENPTRGNDDRGQEIEWALQATGRGQYGGPHSRPTQTTGNDMPYDNMPPFVALQYCRRSVE